MIAFLSGKHVADIPTRCVALMLSKSELQPRRFARVGLVSRLGLSSELLGGQQTNESQLYEFQPLTTTNQSVTLRAAVTR